MKKFSYLVLFLAFTLTIARAAQLSSQEKTIAAGKSGQVDINFTAGADEFTGFLFDIQYDASVLTVSANAGSAVSSAEKQLTTSNPESGVLRCLIWGVNTNVVESGTLVKLTVGVSASADAGDYNLQFKNATATGTDSREVSVSTQNGKVTVSSSGTLTYTTDGSGVWSVSDGVYTMNGRRDQTHHFLYFNQDYCDVDFQVDARKTQGDREGYSHTYGILFREQDGTLENTYLFLIVKSGKYLIGKYVDGDWVTVNEWASTEHLNTGFTTWNTIRVKAVGNQLTFYANGFQLVSLSDDSFSCGKVGLDAFDHPEADIPDTVEFKNVQISSVSVQQPQQEPVLWFPQYVNGATSGYLNKTRIILRNNGNQTESGEIVFRDSNGSLASIPINGVPVSLVNFTLPPWGSTEIVTDGTGELVVGAIEVTSNQSASSNLEGTEIFELEGNSVSVSSSNMASAQQIYVSVNDQENTGFAAYNPSASSNITLNAYLLDHQGNEVRSASIVLAPHQQLARFVNQEELFKSYFDNNPGSFQGTLNIHVSESKPVALLGILLRSDSGAMIAVSPSTRVYSPPN